MLTNFDIAVLIPCYNESLTIQQVIRDFKAIIPNSKIYVYDNNSDDNTAQLAQEAGAHVYEEKNKGKGNVVRRMFADIDADVYVLVDGDAENDPSIAPSMIQKLINEKLDMVVGTRETDATKNTQNSAYRFGHKFGNRLFSKIVNLLFGSKFTDIFSGYRVFSYRFVKSFPANAKGFDIETELTIHCLEMRLPTTEISTKYFKRPEGSQSKLNSIKDGFKILIRIIILLKETRPIFFFGSFCILFFLTSITLFFPVWLDFLETGIIQAVSTAILSTGLMVLAFISLICGIILDTVSRNHRAIKRINYLSIPFFRSGQSKKENRC